MKTICWLEDVWRNTGVPNHRKGPGNRPLRPPRARRSASTTPITATSSPGWSKTTRAPTRSTASCGAPSARARSANALGASHGGKNSDPGRVTCFCEFCPKKARERGIRPERAREGFLALEKFVRASARRPAPRGRLLRHRSGASCLRYPEIARLGEVLWTDSLRETYAAIYQAVKSAKADVPVGWHIWHNNSFNPIYRAEQDLQELSKYSDFLKMVMYHNCGGERMASYVDSVGATAFGDVPPAGTARLPLPRHELPREELRADSRHGPLAPITSTARPSAPWKAPPGRSTRIWPGIDIDIPTDASHSKSTPQGTKEAVLAAFRAGAHGVLLSRKYSEMKLANLAGAGDAIKELGI